MKIFIFVVLVVLYIKGLIFVLVYKDCEAMKCNIDLGRTGVEPLVGVYVQRPPVFGRRMG